MFVAHNLFLVDLSTRWHFLYDKLSLGDLSPICIIQEKFSLPIRSHTLYSQNTDLRELDSSKIQIQDTQKPLGGVFRNSSNWRPS